jgi:hypothetical protein
MGAVDACRGNIYDAPNLAYIKDEGTILRKILSSFSIRPITLQMNKFFPYGVQGSYNFMPQTDAHQLANVTRVPMIVVSLPYSASFMNPTGFAPAGFSIHQQFTSQAFVENKMIVQKTVSVLDVQEVLIYYVPRRQHTINPNIYYNCNYSMLPLSISGWQKMNDMAVTFEKTHKEASYEFYLRSVVLIEETEVNTQSGKSKLITGCSAVLIPVTGQSQSTTEFKYDPQGSINSVKAASGQYEYNEPVTSFDWATREEEIKTHGTIFIYQRKLDAPCIDGVLQPGFATTNVARPAIGPINLAI